MPLDQVPFHDASIAPFDWANPEVIGSFHGENPEQASLGA